MPRRPSEVHVPSGTGPGALDELDRVAWGELDHAYGTGKVGDALHEDVKASLKGLANTPDESLFALSCNVVHQGTIYEATAHAVPFMAAVAAGDVRSALRRELAVLLGHIAIASTFEAIDGGHSGSHGADVGETTRKALAASDKHLRAIGAQRSELAELMSAIGAVASSESPRGDQIDRIAEQLDTLEDDDDDDDDAPVESVPERWYRHAKLGVGKLVGEEPKGLRLRFEDGTERLILASFLTEIDEP
jgi:hypothetical protein